VLSRDYLGCLLQGTSQFIFETAVLLPVGKAKKQPHTGALFNWAGTGEMPIPLHVGQIPTHLGNWKLLPCYSRPLDLTPVEDRGKERTLCLSGPSWCGLQDSITGRRYLPQHRQFCCPPVFTRGGL